MPDPARVAQARVLEIPVTIQGSKTVEGTEQRELFTESTKTALTFENGAALSLQSRVSPGQSLFLRNEQTGREILCKVLEAPPQGETGYTDLEFTVPDPQFWGVDPEQPEPAEQPAPAVEKSETHPEPEAAAENTLAMMGAPASTITVPSAPAPVETSPSEESSAPPREEIMPAHAQAPEPPSASLPDAPPDPEHVPEFNPAKFEETLAALLDGDTKRAKRAAAKKEKEAQKAASQGAVEGETSADALGEAEVVPVKPTLEQLLTTGKGAIVVEIAASIVIAVCLGLIWRAVRSPFAYETSQPIAASGPSKQKAPAAAPRPSPKPASIVASGVPAGAAPTKTGNPNGGTAAASRSNNASATPTQSAAKVQQPAAAQVPAVKIAMTPAATSTAVVAAGSSKAVEGSLESTGPRVIVSRNAITVDSGTQENHRKSGQPDSDGNVPARIVSQVQPAFPSWAKSLDVDGVVKLDALIDEKGNVAQTKVLSGPRPLQHAAQQAVGLWIFEPAQSDGKPTATHMVLTVEFQR